jgi:hypothetical protein
MADRHLEADTPELRGRWGGFAFNAEWDAKAKAAIARYPAGRQRSAVMALLDYAQRQIGAETNTQGWLPIPVMEYIARYLDMPVIRVVEVATFYTMYNLVPFPCAGLRHDALHVARVRRHHGRLQGARYAQGSHHRRRHVDAYRGGVHGQLRLRAYGPD